MAWVALYLASLTELLTDLWLYFIMGFVTAGLVSEFIPHSTLLRYLGKNNIPTLLRATFAGTVASVCSCGAIPIAVTLRQGGASRAAALTFLLASPWAGFMQLAIFYSFLGLEKTMVIFSGALVVAFGTGLVLGRLEEAGLLGPACLTQDLKTAPADTCVSPGQPGHSSLKARLVQAARYGWEAFLELWKYLAVGLLLAAALRATVPASWITRYLGSEAPFNPLLTAVPVAAVIELCSEGFSIFAGQLYRMGATLPVVFVIVLVGVTTDFTELSVIFGKFGKRSALAYVLTSTLLALSIAWLMQSLGR